MKKDEQEKTTVELNDEENLDFDDEVGTSDVDFETLVKASVEKAKKQSIAYTDKRIQQVNEKLAQHQQMLEAHNSRIENIEKVVEALASGGNVSVLPAPQAGNQPQSKNLLDVTLGTVGGILHGVVDTAAFICESAVDLVTLGKARRPVQ